MNNRTCELDEDKHTVTRKKKYAMYCEKTNEMIEFDTVAEMQEYEFNFNNHPNFYFDEDKTINNIEYYLYKAMNKQKFKNKRSLCEALDVSYNVINMYKKGLTCPSDLTMAKLAELAEENMEKALAELNIWRAPSELVENYKNIFNIYLSYNNSQK